MTLLSICIPTYNRGKYLEVSLKRITQEDVFLNTTDIEIVISDNASDDNTEEVVNNYIGKFPNKIRYNRNSENIKDKNFPLVLSLANGEFLKLHNDTVYFRKGGLNKLIEVVKNNRDKNAIYFSNGCIGCEPKYIECENANALYQTGHHWLTWNCGLCIKKEAFNKLDNPTRFSKYQWGQFDILMRLVKNSPAVLCDEKIMTVQQIPNKLTFNGIETFSHKYFTVLKELMKEEILDKTSMNDKFLKSKLIEINDIAFDYFKQCRYNRGYFKYVYRYYWNKPYFYKEFFKGLLFKILYIPYFYSTGYKNYIDKMRWQRKNRHNSTILKNLEQQRQVKVGDNSSGVIEVVAYSNNPMGMVYIGNNVKIGKNVKFIISTANEAEIPEDSMFDEGKNGEIIVEDNVTIGDNVIIKAGSIIEKNSVIQENSLIEPIATYSKGHVV